MQQKHLFRNDIIFDSKPDPVPYHYRLSYRAALSSLILRKTTGRSGFSLAKLHLVTTSMYSNKGMEELLNYVNRHPDNYIILRFDPTVNKTVEFMLADEFIYQQQNGLFRLTKKGRNFADEIMREGKLLQEEISFLDRLSTRLTESMMNDLTNKLMG